MGGIGILENENYANSLFNLPINWQFKIMKSDTICLLTSADISQNYMSPITMAVVKYWLTICLHGVNEWNLHIA